MQACAFPGVFGAGNSVAEPLQAAPPPPPLAPPKSPDLDISLLEACILHDRNVTAMKVHETCIGSVFVGRWRNSFMAEDVSVLLWVKH
jgi:hypothetical protein